MGFSQKASGYAAFHLRRGGYLLSFPASTAVRLMPSTPMSHGLTSQAETDCSITYLKVFPPSSNSRAQYLHTCFLHWTMLNPPSACWIADSPSFILQVGPEEYLLLLLPSPSHPFIYFSCHISNCSWGGYLSIPFLLRTSSR